MAYKRRVYFRLSSSDGEERESDDRLLSHVKTCSLGLYERGEGCSFVDAIPMKSYAGVFSQPHLIHGGWLALVYNSMLDWFFSLVCNKFFSGVRLCVMLLHSAWKQVFYVSFALLNTLIDISHSS